VCVCVRARACVWGGGAAAEIFAEYLVYQDNIEKISVFYCL
jgi:hypothetical protein